MFHPPIAARLHINHKIKTVFTFVFKGESKMLRGCLDVCSCKNQLFKCCLARQSYVKEKYHGLLKEI